MITEIRSVDRMEPTSSNTHTYRIEVTNFGAIRISNSHHKDVEVTIYTTEWIQLVEFVNDMLARNECMRQAIQPWEKPLDGFSELKPSLEP